MVGGKLSQRVTQAQNVGFVPILACLMVDEPVNAIELVVAPFCMEVKFDWVRLLSIGMITPPFGA